MAVGGFNRQPSLHDIVSQIKQIPDRGTQVPAGVQSLDSRSQDLAGLTHHGQAGVHFGRPRVDEVEDRIDLRSNGQLSAVQDRV